MHIINMQIFSHWKKMTIRPNFHCFLTPRWPFCIYKSCTAQPYQRCSGSCLWLSFMIPLCSSTSLINWTTSHYTGLSFPIGHFSSQDCENSLGWWSSFIQSCSRRYLFLLLHGLRKVQLQQLQITLASGYRPTLSDLYGMWTSAEHDLKTRINLSFHCLINCPATITDWPIKRITNEDLDRVMTEWG